MRQEFQAGQSDKTNPEYKYDDFKRPSIYYSRYTFLLLEYNVIYFETN